MKTLRGQEGIALVVSLMFTMICLVMILTLLYLVLSGTKNSGAQARYRSSQEASYGAADFVTKTAIPRLFSDYTGGKRTLLSDFGRTDGFGLVLGDHLREKLSTATANWTGSSTANAKEFPDLAFQLPGQNGDRDFTVYTKIVDTVPGVGMLDLSGVDYLDGGIGVAGAGSSNQSLRTPHIFTVEVQGERALNPRETSKLTVLYAY